MWLCSLAIVPEWGLSLTDRKLGEFKVMQMVGAAYQSVVKLSPP
jgi:hypothetical protein